MREVESKLKELRCYIKECNRSAEFKFGNGGKGLIYYACKEHKWSGDEPMGLEDYVSLVVDV